MNYFDCWRLTPEPAARERMEGLVHEDGSEGHADRGDGGLQRDAAYGEEDSKYENERADGGYEDGGEGLPQQSKRQRLVDRREPSWHSFTAPVDGMAKKRRCCQPGCQVVIHHGLAQWVEHIVGSNDKKSIKRCVQPSAAATAEAEEQRRIKLAGTEKRPVVLKRPTHVVTGSKDVMQDVISNTPACVLRPLEFFISWGGVATLAFTGFPAPLVTLKGKLNAHSLAPEASGSKWPKTTLGALKDGRRLTPEQLAVLHRICKEESRTLQPGEFVRVDDLSVVLFECPSLERLLGCETVPLDAAAFNPADPTEEERARTRAVLDEFSEERLGAYWVHAARDGSGESHYRKPALGATLVHFLKEAVPAAVGRFRARVDEELPELYSWFGDKALHVTVRGLMG